MATVKQITLNKDMWLQIDWDNDRHQAVPIHEPFGGVQVWAALMDLAKILVTEIEGEVI